MAKQKAYFVYAHTRPGGGCRVYADWGRSKIPSGKAIWRFYDTLPSSGKMSSGHWIHASSASAAKAAGRADYGISCSRPLSGASKRRRR